MQYFPVTDWDDAYSNIDHVPDAEGTIARLPVLAQEYREKLASEGRARLDVSYGPGERNRTDFFEPAGDSRGLFIFVHGGYWRRFSRDMWSHLAHGALERGYSVAMPSYTLCPDIRISGITREVGEAVIHAASQHDGPIRLAGHSAGGHLAARMVCANSPLPTNVRERIRLAIAISPVTDLRPLLRLNINETLQLDAGEAASESPALLEPMDGLRMVCWAGQSELFEFVRHNQLLANVWHGLGAQIRLVEEANKNHFTVTDGLADPDSPICRTLFGHG